jgi:hypothetical protein
MEVIQEAKRAKVERGGIHLTFAVDELKFLISKELSDALATSLGHGVNMIVLHQSIEDLRGPEDKTLNAEAIEKSVLINCQVKVLYKCDPETAEWGAKLSGTKMVESTRMQKMHINHFGGEVFERERSISLTEEGLIPENTLLTLSPMVGAFYTPHDLAKVVFTSPVPTQKGDDIFLENPVYTEWRMANLKREKEDQGPKILLDDKPASQTTDTAKSETQPQQSQKAKSSNEKPAQPVNQPKKEGQNTQAQSKSNQPAGNKQPQNQNAGNKQQAPSKLAQSQANGQQAAQNKADNNNNKQNQNTQKQNNQAQAQPKQEQQTNPKPQQPNSDNKQAQPKPAQDAGAKSNAQPEKNKQQGQQTNNKGTQNPAANTNKNEQQKQVKPQASQPSQKNANAQQQNNAQKPKQFDLNELKEKASSDIVTPDQLMDAPPAPNKSNEQKPQEKKAEQKTTEQASNSTDPDADAKRISDG